MSQPGTPPASVMVYVGLDRIGDGLLKLPFVQTLRRAFPDARITWVAGKETSVYAGIMAPVVKGILDEVIENAGIGQHPKEFLRRPLPGRRFDLIVDTQRIVWASLSLKRVPHRLFISSSARFLLSSRKPPKDYQRPKSMLRQLLDLLELASGKAFETPAGMDLDLDPALAEEAAGLLPKGPVYVGIAPGAGGRPKCWPLQNFVAMAKEQTARRRIPVFVLGPKEIAWKSELAGAVPEALFPLQEDGVEEAHHFSPQFTIALSKRFAACLSNDSGVGHMLALGGRPLISLYGTTSPEKFRPMSGCLTIVRATDFGGEEIERIPVDAVIQAVDRALSA